MFFLRKKRQKRDREAGLIFHWRGAKKHHLGKIIAMMVATGFFAFSVYAIKIDGIKSPLLTKREGVVIMLDPDDPNCRGLMYQVEERSPFPARWDPAYEPEIFHRIKQKQQALFGSMWSYQPKLVPLPEDKSPHALASVVEPDDGLLGWVMDGWKDGKRRPLIDVSGDLLVVAKVVATGELKKHIGRDELALPVGLVADDWFGQAFRFQVSLYKNGYVDTCVPLSGGTIDAPNITDRQKDLAAWLRSLRFMPAEGESKTPRAGQLELQIQASRG